MNGSLTGASLNVSPNATITGARFLLTSVPSFMEVKIPTGLPDLGRIDVRGGAYTIPGPGSFTASGISLTNGALLSIDNSAGPVTLYVTGPVTMGVDARITVQNPDPEEFAVYVQGKSPVSLRGDAASSFYGVLYAPASTVTIGTGGSFYGAFVGATVQGGGRIHYAASLRSVSAATETAAAAGTHGATTSSATKSTSTRSLR